MHFRKYLKENDTEITTLTMEQIFFFFHVLLLSGIQTIQDVGSVDVRDEDCPEWTTLRPYSDHVDSKCYFSVSNHKKMEFLHSIRTKSYNFVNMILTFPSHNVSETGCAVEGDHWTWTFPGPEGARQNLNWPLEYRVWSLGLLNVYILDDYIVPITVHGDCPIVFGESGTVERISLALANLTDYLVKQSGQRHQDYNRIESYNKSYWCYKERIINRHTILYNLCKIIICPFETIGYRCCQWKWDFLKRSRHIECSGKHIKLKKMGWYLPFGIGVVLCLYFPILLVWTLSHIHKLTYKYHRQNGSTYDFNTNLEKSSPEERMRDQNWIFYNPVNMGTIVIDLLYICCVRFPVGTSRCVRLVFLIMSVSVLATKLSLYEYFHSDYVVACVAKGVPKMFDSILAGYELGKTNFLTIFGGPIIACILYAICYILTTCVPADMAIFIERGLEVWKSPLQIDDSVRTRYGAMKRNKLNNGYYRIYCVLSSHFFMVLNPTFWKYVIGFQHQRWKKIETFCSLRSGAGLRMHLYRLLVFPFYIPFCTSELIACLLYYGIPSVCFLKIVLCSYVVASWRQFRSCRPLRVLYCVITIVILLFAKYMFDLIFLDSFIFICDLFVFSYTGFFAHPEATYGYFVFSLTIIFYVTESVNGIATIYDDIFIHTRKICKKMQKYGKHKDVDLFNRDDENKGIPKDMFFMIVAKHKPIRHQVFISLLKLAAITVVLYLSVELLVEFSTSHKLNILTQVTATIIICLVPKFVGNSFSLFRNRSHHHQSSEIKRIIYMYCENKRLTNTDF